MQLFLTLPNVTGLKLYLPSAFSKETHRFIGPQGSCASAANYYHEKFRGITGIESMREISHVHRMEGVHIACEPVAPGLGGFFARNKKVALAADAVLAYTWALAKSQQMGNKEHLGPSCGQEGSCFLGQSTQGGAKWMNVLSMELSTRLGTVKMELVKAE